MTASMVLAQSDFRVTPDYEIELLGDAVGSIGAVRAVTAEPDTTTCETCGVRVGWVFDCREDPEQLVWCAPVVERFGRIRCEECCDAQ